MMGVDSIEPKTPPLETVNVPPAMSSIEMVPSLALRPMSPSALSMSAKFILSTFLITGTTRPCGRGVRQVSSQEDPPSWARAQRRRVAKQEGGTCTRGHELGPVERAIVSASLVIAEAPSSMRRSYECFCYSTMVSGVKSSGRTSRSVYRLATLAFAMHVSPTLPEEAAQLTLGVATATEMSV